MTSREKVLAALAVAALVLSVAALLAAFSNVGPRGATGARGPQGIAGPVGPRGGTAQVAALHRCLDEFAVWVQSFYVSTQWQSQGTQTWLTSALLDESAQQMTTGCRRMLGLLSN